MQKSERIVSYTADELRAMRERGEDQSNWAAVAALTEEELEASIDYEEEGEFDLSKGFAGLPPMKKQVTVRLDQDIIDFFKKDGRGYQTRMNAELRNYVEAKRKDGVQW